ncbi:MAG: aldolase [Patescibacteria group bacterium]
MNQLTVPLSVPLKKRAEYQKNLRQATANSGRLLLFAGDQKVEHLNADFVGPNVSPADASPEHLFQIAAAAPVGVFATQLGLISRYGTKYQKVPYLVKINGRSNLYKDYSEVKNEAWWSVADVLSFKEKSGLNILGIGYTVYLGGKNETQMLKEAAQVIKEAHNEGLLAVIWMYPRGEKINEAAIKSIAGGAGIAAALGADFVKTKYPYTKTPTTSAKKFQEAVLAAGQTKVICVGGGQQKAEDLLKHAWEQINTAKANGMAIGRNLHQRPLEEAIRLATALSLIINHDASLAEALAVYHGRKKISPLRKTKSKFLGLF